MPCYYKTTEKAQEAAASAFFRTQVCGWATYIVRVIKANPSADVLNREMTNSITTSYQYYIPGLPHFLLCVLLEKSKAFSFAFLLDEGLKVMEKGNSLLAILNPHTVFITQVPSILL